MKRLTNFLVVLMCVLFISGCGDISKIKNVKKLAIAGVTFKRDFVTVNENGEDVSGVNLLSFGSKSGDDEGGITLTPVDKEALAYYKGTYGRVVSVFKRHGIDVVDANDFSDNETFKKFQFTTNDSIFSNDYSPEPFASGVGQDNELVKTLATELGVDAVGLFTLEVVKIKGKAMLGLLPSEKLGLRAKLTVVAKDGSLIIGHQVFMVESDEKIEWANMVAGGALGDAGSFIDISPQNQETFSKLSEKFVQKIDSHLRKGLEE